MAAVNQSFLHQIFSLQVRKLCRNSPLAGPNMKACKYDTCWQKIPCDANSTLLYISLGDSGRYYPTLFLNLTS